MKMEASYIPLTCPLAVSKPERDWENKDCVCDQCVSWKASARVHRTTSYKIQDQEKEGLGNLKNYAHIHCYY